MVVWRNVFAVIVAILSFIVGGLLLPEIFLTYWPDFEFNGLSRLILWGVLLLLASVVYNLIKVDKKDGIKEEIK
ncbi:hypothetical protein [Sediminibacterium sp.]|uniref:hypothetical protein n=1 Tax=Sediminibacterium sp. TaxID=1917865 RepID=UPI00273340EE|nr:hypothetical protein [Sediminibacterium sp.]MDP3566389.1 hypothetical protein [Sediminibacterium sp.]